MLVNVKNRVVFLLKRSLKIAIGLLYLYSGLAFLTVMITKWIKPNRKKLLILMYHGIGDESLNIADNVPLRSFMNQLDYLVKNYKVVSFKDGISYLTGEKGEIKENIAVLTFDDAYKSVFDKVYPLLKEKKIPATVFVPVNHIGKAGEWEREEKEYNGQIMDWDMLRKLSADDLFTLGSHGMSHKKLSSLSHDVVREELMESKKILEEELQHEVKYFSYPYGQATECRAAIVDDVEKSGYFAACSTIWGRYSSSKHVFALRRIRVDYHDSMLDFKLKLKGMLDWIEYLHLIKGKAL